LFVPGINDPDPIVNAGIEYAVDVSPGKPKYALHTFLFEPPGN
jgi:hypothetical protein